MARNPLSHQSKSVTGPALESFAITPSDSADLSTHIRAITLNQGGTLSWDSYYGTTHTTAALPAGTYPLFARRIRATGTTATGLTGWV